MIILDKTPLAAWHRLLGEVQKNSQIFLTEDLESYLAFTLMRFSQNTALAKSVVALEFLSAIDTNDPQSLRDVGDKCLLLRGLFPARATARKLPLEYFSFVGQSAYLTIAGDLTHALGTLYGDLAHEFNTLSVLLGNLRKGTQTSYDLGFLDLHPIH